MKFIVRIIRFIYRKTGNNFNEIVRKEQHKKFTILSENASNDYLKSLIDSGRPSMISRLGAVESNCILNWMQMREYATANLIQKVSASFKGNVSEWNEQVKIDLQNLAGFFPATDENLFRFCSIYTSKISQADAIVIWGFVPGENFIIKNYCASALKLDPQVLDPYFFDSPWTSKLKNKKVLVIHPFAESIRFQYAKKELLFENKSILPDFELHTIKTVQSIARNKTQFKDWFAALEFMKSEIVKVDFEIALISGGAYGLPLAAFIKDLGKCAVHMGGSLQILFGIKGKRWDEHPPTAALYNEHWVRPALEEIVPKADIVEGGCYW